MNYLKFCLLLALSNFAYAISELPISAGLLGDGVNLDRKIIQSKCVEGNVVYSGGKNVSVSFKKVTSQKRLRTLLNLETAGSINLEVIEASGATEFLLDSQSNKFKDSFVYNYTLGGINARLQGEKFDDSLIIPQDVSAESVCGTHFIKGLELGASLLVNVSFEFLDESLKTHFDAEVNVDLIDIFQGYGKGSTDYDEYKNKVKVSVTARQIGGLKSNVASVFSSEADGVSIVKCDISNLTKCQKTLENIIKFASTTFVSEFETLQYSTDSYNALAVLKVWVSSYYDANIYQVSNSRPALLSQYIRDRREELMEKYISNSVDLKMLNNILDTHLSDTDRDHFYSLKEKLEDNISKIVSTTSICHEFPKMCESSLNDLKLFNYDRSVFDRNFSFWDYCSMSSISKEKRHFLNTLKQYFGLRDNVSCGRLEDLFLNARKLDLSSSKLEDLELLKFAKNLEVLILRNNNIYVIDWISDLKNLKYVDLSFNKIQFLPNLDELKDLKHLNLSKNNILGAEELIPLLKGTYLDFISIASNPLYNESIIKELEKYAPKRFEDAFFTEDDVCEKWRRIALKYGKISKQEYQFLQELQVVPMFPNWKNPAYGEVRESGACSIHIDKLLRLF